MIHSKSYEFLLKDISTLKRVGQKTKKIFKWLKKSGIFENEMLKTFNCGVGFCLVINPKNLNKVYKYFPKKFKPYVIGKISKNSKKVKLCGKINWK